MRVYLFELFFLVAMTVVFFLQGNNIKPVILKGW